MNRKIVKMGEENENERGKILGNSSSQLARQCIRRRRRR